MKNLGEVVDFPTNRIFFLHFYCVTELLNLLSNSLFAAISFETLNKLNHCIPIVI